MAKTKTSKKNTKPTMIIFDFTEVYNNMKAEQERDLAEAAAYAIAHVDEKQKIIILLKLVYGRKLRTCLNEESNL